MFYIKKFIEHVIYVFIKIRSHFLFRYLYRLFQEIVQPWLDY